MKYTLRSHLIGIIAMLFASGAFGSGLSIETGADLFYMGWVQAVVTILAEHFFKSIK